MPPSDVNEDELCRTNSLRTAATSRSIRIALLLLLRHFFHDHFCQPASFRSHRADADALWLSLYDLARLQRLTAFTTHYITPIREGMLWLNKEEFGQQVRIHGGKHELRTNVRRLLSIIKLKARVTAGVSDLSPSHVTIVYPDHIGSQPEHHPPPRISQARQSLCRKDRRPQEIHVPLPLFQTLTIPH
ncbi:hypothetical protein PHLGIDRAFT_245219 [Phlebiopsis gigantea 11061_1 CR5-6]|uniref:Uncharacterized protein n=1 Tax=Phlebiopsis gigantea (strain 11061_1 CR5-6) TaxID=745531 RepID=A0A0C3PDG1_PHLG1|nr:hypothetical protein PHLGIDRAFT_245219 [Phlebiopsis gigantea 11061_1 CR5-6]